MNKKLLSLLMTLSVFLSLMLMFTSNASATNYYGITYTLKEGKATSVEVRSSTLESLGYNSYTCFFTPSESGWYTFIAKNQNDAGVFCLYSEALGEHGDYFYLSESGGHYYLQGGVKYELILQTLGMGDTWTADIYVQHSNFQQLQEYVLTSFPINQLRLGDGEYATEYMKFEPSETGIYYFEYSPKEWSCSGGGIFSADGKRLEHDRVVTSSGFILTTELAANNTYYLANYQAEGTCDIYAYYEAVSADDSPMSCTEHKFTSTGGDICTACGYEFEPELIEYNKTMYAAIDNAAVRNQPYAKAGTLVDKLSKGEAVKVTHYFYNSLGGKWYVLQDGNYVYSERLTSTGVKKYTLTFNANGSGVTNLPEAVQIQEGVGMAIPGKISGIPNRDGYTFVGYSTDKNATTAQYVPGRSIKLTKDTTLYVIWHKKASNLDNLSSETIEALNKSVGIQQPKGSGKCTKSATATLLKRRQIATGNAGTFSLNDIEKGAGYSAINPGSNTYKSNGNTYTCTAIQPKQINTDPTKYIVELLNEHPEGIVIYCDYYNLYSKKPSQHAVVISDYEIDESGDYRFYAYDPGMSNTKRMRFEETTLYKGCNSAEHPEYMKVTSYPSYANVFSNFKNKSCGCIWYVETES